MVRGVNDKGFGRMTSLRLLTLLAGSAVALSGCVAGIAASAVSMAVRSAQGRATSNEQLKPVAERYCSAQAAGYGAVRIIDVEQHTPSKIIVWGTVNDGRERRSFECGFGTKVTSFKLRAIPPR